MTRLYAKTSISSPKKTFETSLKTRLVLDIFACFPHFPPPLLPLQPLRASSSARIAPRKTQGFPLNLSGVGVRAQALAAHTGDNVDEASVVLHALLRPAQ